MSETAYRKYYNRPDLKWQKQREIDFYRKMDGVAHFPHLHAVDEAAIYITDCDPLMDVLADVSLSDVRAQLSEILASLHEAGIRHRDITTGNLCWKDGVLYLVDFGWAIWSTEEDSPEPVPQVMRDWMCEKSDDRQALETLAKLMEAKP